FRDIPAMTIKKEMLQLAEHIIKTKKGKFDIAKFDDRYEASLADLVKAKLEGRTIAKRKEPKRETVIDLMAALRESAGRSGRSASRKTATKATTRRRSAKQTAARRKAS